jgi:hypothetical protein
VISGASVETIVMLGLPAHGGQEITGEVMEGLQRVVRDKLDHRLHARVPVLVRLSPESGIFPRWDIITYFLFCLTIQDKFGNI